MTDPKDYTLDATSERVVAKFIADGNPVAAYWLVCLENQTLVGSPRMEGQTMPRFLRNSDATEGFRAWLDRRAVLGVDLSPHEFGRALRAATCSPSVVSTSQGGYSGIKIPVIAEAPALFAAAHGLQLTWEEDESFRPPQTVPEQQAAVREAARIKKNAYEAKRRNGVDVKGPVAPLGASPSEQKAFVRATQSERMKQYWIDKRAAAAAVEPDAASDKE